jgi:hypothetical protein
MDEVHEPSDSECYTPSSEPFRIYYNFYVPIEYGTYLY